MPSCGSLLATVRRYKLLGSVQQRLGGTAVVQFATGPKGDMYALKFCVRKAAFDRVAALFSESGSNALMSMVKGTVPNKSNETHEGHVLPPCVVMYAGESLESATPCTPCMLVQACLTAVSLCHMCNRVKHQWTPDAAADWCSFVKHFCKLLLLQWTSKLLHALSIGLCELRSKNCMTVYGFGEMVL
jgi:hypothetical protein